MATDPIVAISAAVQGPAGIVEGSPDLRQLEKFEPTSAGTPGSIVTITDQTGNVVRATPGGPLKLLEKMAGTKLAGRPG